MSLAEGDKVTLSFEDRSFSYEAVLAYRGGAEWEGIGCTALSVPRVLLRADEFRLAHFAPETAPRVTFTNQRNAVLDGRIKGMGRDGFEMVMQDTSKRVQDMLGMGEESFLDLALEDDVRITTHARVAYFGANYVGMRFTDRTETAVLGTYRDWLDRQEQIQAQREREAYLAGGARPAQRDAQAALPSLRVWVDRDPAILVVTEREDFARRLAEALGRKYGILSLDYIKGPFRPFLAAEAGWGRARLILVHNQLRLASPLELCRQVVEQEKCPLPVLLAGAEEDLELKRNRALAAGAVDYLPVEPFRILSVLRKLDETFKIFES